MFSGPVGSTIGQQPVHEGALVREFQPAQWGWTPHYGVLEVRARMDLSPRSMAAVWMVGLEDEPERCGEICLFEVFGDAPAVAVGMGVHPFRDPALTEEWDAPHVAIDVGRAPRLRGRLAARPGRLHVDGEHVKTVNQAPDYPMQMMVAVFDFPDKPGPAGHVPEFAVDWVRGHERTSTTAGWEA